MNIKINEKYLSGLTASTDLHAGGIFFCIVYKKCLVFSESGTVRLSNELFDAFRPLDSEDAELMKSSYFEGRYFFNDRNYLICEFERIDLVLTGLNLDRHPDILAFHAHKKGVLGSWGEVFMLEADHSFNLYESRDLK
jgi:hypothetical protein